MFRKILARIGLVFIIAFAFSCIPSQHSNAESIQSVVTAAIPVRTIPVRVIIPSIGLDSPIEALGATANGEMAVPSGTTKNVGWYKYGTAPGDVGSAVFDAHVFAAFSKLSKLKVGSDIYVINSDGQRLHFVATAATTYALSQVDSAKLFARNDDRRLNLITCAGNMTKDRSTYDHRLVVYTTLVHDPEFARDL